MMSRKPQYGLDDITTFRLEVNARSKRTCTIHLGSFRVELNNKLATKLIDVYKSLFSCM